MKELCSVMSKVDKEVYPKRISVRMHFMNAKVSNLSLYKLRTACSTVIASTSSYLCIHVV